MSQLDEFRTFRERMNERILGQDNLDIKRFFALDSRVYENGALPTRTKELLGLVASLVLRCDDCITYHITRCAEEGVGDDEMFECFSVGLVVAAPSSSPISAAPSIRSTASAPGSSAPASGQRAPGRPG